MACRKGSPGCLMTTASLGGGRVSLTLEMGSCRVLWPLHPEGEEASQRLIICSAHATDVDCVADRRGRRPDVCDPRLAQRPDLLTEQVHSPPEGRTDGRTDRPTTSGELSAPGAPPPAPGGACRPAVCPRGPRTLPPRPSHPDGPLRGHRGAAAVGEKRKPMPACRGADTSTVSPFRTQSIGNDD